MDGIVDGPGGVRLIDRTGRKILPIGYDSWERIASDYVLVDKTMLIADLLESGYKATLFCRPRRFGKSINMSMLRSYFELPVDQDGVDARGENLFEGTKIWDASNGAYRAHMGAYPVVYFNLNSVKKSTWSQAYGELKLLIRGEFARHGYLYNSDRHDREDRAFLSRLADGNETEADYAGSLLRLVRMLAKHHGRPVILLIDEYDAPVMAGYSAPQGGYYDEVVEFLKGWLTGAIKDAEPTLSFACLTGVQRISKESIFSDLNNLAVSTPLSRDFDERFGFTDGEVSMLAEYLGYEDRMSEARAWYDGYRFGRQDVYNPWSVLNYFKQGGSPRAYWANTSGNTVLGEMVKEADEITMEKLYRLCAPEGSVLAPLDLGVVFPDAGKGSDKLWSMLYLAGYLTTDEGEHEGEELGMPYELRLPNREIASLFKNEIVARFSQEIGGIERLYDLYAALTEGDADRLRVLLQMALDASAGYYDLQSENSVHMLLLGLLYGVPGYAAPLSNRESGDGRFDIMLAPMQRVGMDRGKSKKPAIIIEVKFAKLVDGKLDAEAIESKLIAMANEALTQIDVKRYGAVFDVKCDTANRLHYGIAFAGKHAAVARKSHCCI